MKPTMPPEMEALKIKRAALREEAGEVVKQIGALRRAALDAAGWKPCCRCYPGAVGDDGFCGCCLYNHDTGVRMEEFKDPDYDDAEVTRG